MLRESFESWTDFLICHTLFVVQCRGGGGRRDQMLPDCSSDDLGGQYVGTVRGDSMWGQYEGTV